MKLLDLYKCYNKRISIINNEAIISAIIPKLFVYI